MKSYTSKTVAWHQAIGNFISQYRALKRQSGNMVESMGEIVEGYQQVEEYIGKDLSQCRVLEIGHGQLPLQNAYFACRAKSAIGLDVDVVPNGLNPLKYIELLRSNGVKRTIKTLSREFLGINRNFRNAFVKTMGIQKFPALDLRRGDATKKIELPDNSIDVIYSTDVFEHLSDPENAILEMKRILAPGGTVVTRTLHWGHFNALHDIRVIVGEVQGRWAHLRPSISKEVQQGAYVNELRICDWLQLFEKHFEKMAHQLVPCKEPELAQLKIELAAARQADELAEYGDEELLAFHLLMRCDAE